MSEEDKRPEEEKKIDEALKDAGNDFSMFITGLSMQALISLGEIPHPVSNKKEPNLNQAKYMIDTLGMIKEKTKGNLKPDEEKVLEGMLYNLRMKYLESSKKKEAE